MSDIDKISQQPQWSQRQQKQPCSAPPPYSVIVGTQGIVKDALFNCAIKDPRGGETIKDLSYGTLRVWTCGHLSDKCGVVNVPCYNLFNNDADWLYHRVKMFQNVETTILKVIAGARSIVLVVGNAECDEDNTRSFVGAVLQAAKSPMLLLFDGVVVKIAIEEYGSTFSGMPFDPRVSFDASLTKAKSIFTTIVHKLSDRTRKHTLSVALCDFIPTSESDSLRRWNKAMNGDIGDYIIDYDDVIHNFMVYNTVYGFSLDAPALYSLGRV